MKLLSIIEGNGGRKEARVMMIVLLFVVCECIFFFSIASELGVLFKFISTHTQEAQGHREHKRHTHTQWRQGCASIEIGNVTTHSS